MSPGRSKYLGKLCDIVERAHKTLAPAPWRPDIDDPGTPIEAFTGKFYVGEGDDVTWADRVVDARALAELRNALPAILEELQWSDE